MRKIIKLAAPPRGFFDSKRTRLYCRPIDLIYNTKDDQYNLDCFNQSLVGGDMSFKDIEIILRDESNIYAFRTSIETAREWGLAEGCSETIDKLMLNIAGRRAGILSLRNDNTPLLMGVVNASPDSFYDGDASLGRQSVIARAHSLIEEGADIIDIGGESTRPGSKPISVSEEIDRVISVIENVRGFGVPISIDTSKSSVMQAALAAGASIINDISALTGDPKSLNIAVKSRVPVILMHMRGTPLTMQKNPKYDNPLLDVYDYLQWRISLCTKAGILPENLIVDPGIGFGKNDEQNLSILRRVSLFHSLGLPVMLGVSRKSMIGNLSGGEPADKRLPGSLATALFAAAEGIQFLRVHDVSETKQALRIKQVLTDTF